MERPKSSRQRDKNFFLDFEERNEDNQRLTPINSTSNIQNEDNSSFKLKNNYYFKEDYLINEQLNLLNNLWNSLGINPEYRNSFINNIENITSYAKKDIIIQEKYNMKKLRDSLIEVKREILYRENNIDLLKKYNNILANSFNRDNSINNIIEEIISIIKKLRKNALNIVIKMSKLNKILKEYLNTGKINFYQIKKDYSYDPSYLNKMKTDLLFLQNSAISKYIEMNNSNINPFLTNCAPNQNEINYSNKVNIPISQEFIHIIKNAEYLLMQETLTFAPKDFSNFKEKSKRFNMNLLNDYNNNKEFLKSKNSSFANNSARKLGKRKFVSDFNISNQVKNMKNKYGQREYNKLFLKMNNNNSINFNKFKGGKNIKSNFIRLNENYKIPQNKIRIQHEEINYLSNNEFINNLNQFQTEYGAQNYEENKEIFRNRYNTEFEEESDKFRPLEEIEEQERINLEKEVNNLKNKLKKMSDKANEYEDELKKMNKKKKKNEKELNEKIEILEKENKDRNERIKDLEEKLKHEENLRINKEKELEDMKIKIKEEEEKRMEEEQKRKKEEEERIRQNEIIEKEKEEKRKKEEEEQRIKNEEKENQLNKMIEEQKIAFEEEKEKIKEESKKQEEQINKINEEKTKIEEEKLNLENELNSLKLEKANLQNNLKEAQNNLENNNNILNEQKAHAENDYNLLKNEKSKIESDYSNIKAEKEKLQKEYNTLKGEHEKLKEKVETLEKGILHSINRNKTLVNYRINYYTGNISNLINILVDKISLEMIPDFLRRAFLLNENIFNEEYYFKGIFPKIILSKKSESENSARGICSLYYESNENLDEPILRINSIFAIEDWENQIIRMIDFIKHDMKFKRLELYLLYDKIEGKFIPNQEAKELFQKKLGFKWLCVVRDEKLQQRYIKLYYEEEPKEDIKNEENIENKENNQNEDNNKKEENIQNEDNIKKGENIQNEDNIKKDENKKEDNIKNEDNNKDENIGNKENIKLEDIIKYENKTNDQKEKNENEKTIDSKNKSATQKDYESNDLIEKNNFVMDNLIIVTLNNEEKSNLLKNTNNNDISNKKENYLPLKQLYNKYINTTSIYSLILENPNIIKEFAELNKMEELKEAKQKITRFVTEENDWNNLEEDKKKIKKINFNLEYSLYKEIEKILNENNTGCSCNLFKKNISINFETNYSLLIDDIYYNKITSDKIKILKDKKTKSLFFLIPSNDNTVLFYICEVNKRLKKLLLEKDDNIYDNFLEFQPTLQKEIVDFCTSSYRDISYIPQMIKSSSKTLYIPTFSISTHLFSYKLKNIEKNVTLKENGTNQPIKLTSIDEYINLHFKPDENIKNSFTVIPVQDKKNSFIIKKSFIIGIFDNDIIKNDKLPLLQFLYVTNEHFLTKGKYHPKS